MGFNSAFKGLKTFLPRPFFVILLRINVIIREKSNDWSTACSLPYASFIQSPQAVFVQCINLTLHLSVLPLKVKVRCTLVQALRFCTVRTVYKRCRGKLYPFLTTALKGGEGQLHAPAALYPRERPGTHCTGGWVNPRAGLDRCGKSHHHRDSIPGPSSL